MLYSNVTDRDEVQELRNIVTHQVALLGKFILSHHRSVCHCCCYSRFILLLIKYSMYSTRRSYRLGMLLHG